MKKKLIMLLLVFQFLFDFVFLGKNFLVTDTQAKEKSAKYLYGKESSNLWSEPYYISTSENKFEAFGIGLYPVRDSNGKYFMINGNICYYVTVDPYK